MFNTIKESVIQEFDKRLKNPFLGAFVFSWIFWNWDFLYVALFLDQQYVSFIPDGNIFQTKLEYIMSKSMTEIEKFLFYPIISTVGVILFIEWGTTGFNIFVKFIKNKILGLDLLTKKDSADLKSNLLQIQNELTESIQTKTDTIISLQLKNKELESKIDDKVKLKIKKELKSKDNKIEELQNNLSELDKLYTEGVHNIQKLNGDLDNMLEKYNSSIKKISLLIEEKEVLVKEKEGLELKLYENGLPLEEKYEKEYNKFKLNGFFGVFSKIIDAIEESPEYLKQNFSGKEIRYFETKKIIIENNGKYFFTEKGNKFVEYFLDEYSGDSNEVRVENLPF